MEWKTTGDFLGFIHEYGSYLILRNYETLLDGRISPEHADIDVLCDSAAAFISFSGIETRTTAADQIHRKALIGGIWVDVDVRQIGDGYFDRDWESAALKNRVLFADTFYVMDSVDSYYTLLYHVCTHKKQISADYEKRLSGAAKQIGAEFHREQARADLEAYMRAKRYRYEIPAYGGAVFNLRGADLRLLRFDAGRLLNRCGFTVRKAADKCRRLMNG